MAKQTFTSGQVLTAAEMNSLQENDYNWTVTTKTASYTLAAGDEGTRIVMNNAGATTITVDDAVFAAGDVVWIHNIGAGTCTITAGTATVNTDGSLALSQYQGGQLFFTSASAAIFFPNVGAQAGGKILQVVSATYSTAETTTSGTLVDTSLTASITPSSASNKVLVVITSPLNVNNTGNTTSSGEGRVGIKRDSTDVYSINYQIFYFDSADSTDRGLSVNGTITYMDSPATTSATTYTFRFAASTCTMTAHYQNQISTIVLMEVSA